MTFEDFWNAAPKELENQPHQEWFFKKNEPARIAMLHNVESELSYTLPDPVRDLYLNTNGAVFFNHDNIDGFRLFDVESVIIENRLARELYQEKWIDDILLLMEMIGDGNWIGIKKHDGRHDVIDCFHEVDPEEWQPIESNLFDFMEKVFLKQGGKYWL